MRMFQMMSWLFWMSCKVELFAKYYKRILDNTGCNTNLFSVIPMVIQDYMS